MYFWTGLGITGGYHRLWSHRAYKATYPVRLLLCLGGAAAFEGSAKWWCRHHRSHHRYTDTEKDPYNARNGFWYAHMGWMLQKQDAKKIGFSDISDLTKDSMILWQHKYYPFVAIGVGIIFPTLFASLWGDMRGGFFFASMWRIVIVHHATFFVNSLAHHLGDKSVSDFHTAYDSWITAILTLGEGYHNYHHEFPADYRNGIKFFHYDPTKWFISALSYFGLTYDLKWMSNEEINKAFYQMEQRQLDGEKSKLLYGDNTSNLPSFTWDEVNERILKGEQLVVIEGIIHDVKKFVNEHPGGRLTILNLIGPNVDCTGLFNGKIGNDGLLHAHSKEARKFLYSMRVGALHDDALHQVGA
jgi:stearoyl-CoA desaturase (delta-9 desaturase)